MTPKRIQPSSNLLDSHERRELHAFDSSLEDIPLAKKRMKRDQCLHSWGNLDEQFNAEYQNDEKDEFTEFNDLFGQQFQNLRACSFKTISKTGLDKVVQFDGQFQSGKKKPEFNRMSEQRLRSSEEKQKNRSSGSQRFIGFGSMNQFSRFEKKHSVADCDNFQPLQKDRRKQSSIAGSLHTINTQMINDIMEFNIKDENEINDKYLKNMIEMALIKNVVFTCNLLIRFSERKGEERYFQGIKLYKLLDVDGFSITGFYCDSQKLRVNLCVSITNKQFQRRMNPHSQTSICSDKHKAHHNNNEKGVQFKASLYRSSTYDYQEVRIFISDLKDLKSHSWRGDSGERTSFDNIISIPQAQQSVEMFGSYRDKGYSKQIMK